MISILAATLLGSLPGVLPPDESPFNTSMVQDPAAGESSGSGEKRVYHEGEGEPPETGYFKHHEPGEVAEYHLFVPDNLDRGKLYPLLIVYHGGKDGASGKGTLSGFAKISTREHPVIVLSPNMYTLDAYHELLAEGELPIDTRRVVIFGFSSGGMGVLSAMREFVRSSGAFTPAVLISASTTASMGPATYPQVPYVIMAGEKENPEFVKNEILKNRRSTCRKHTLQMQEVIQEVRYLEMEGYGHTAGKPAHHAVIRNMIRSLPEPEVKLKTSRVVPELQELVRAARAADWPRVQGELARLDSTQSSAPTKGYTTLRGRVLKALESSVKDDVKFITKLGPKSATWQTLRAFQLYDRLEPLPTLFAGTPLGAKLSKRLATLARSKRWTAELEARRRYREIVSEPPSPDMIEALDALRESAPGTEYGGKRTAEKRLALQELV
jgi:dienelactone hydrolase